MLLDTGSAHFLITDDFAPQITGLRVSTAPTEIYGASGISTTFAATAPSVTVGTRTEENPPAGGGTQSGRRDSPARDAVSFAVPNDFRLCPQPASAGACRRLPQARRHPGDIGLQILREGRQFVIGNIDLGGPAYESGILPDDILLAIDDAPVTVDSMTQETANRLLPTREGQTVTLKLRHQVNTKDKADKNEQGKAGSPSPSPYTVTLQAKASFARVDKKLTAGILIDEMRLGNAFHSWMVSSAPPRSGAALAGLRPGDTLRTVQNKPASDFTLSDLMTLFNRPTDAAPIPVTVQRKGVKEPISVSVVPRSQSVLDLLPWGAETTTTSTTAATTAAITATKNAPTVLPATMPLTPMSADIAQAIQTDLSREVVVPFLHDPNDSALLLVRARVNGSKPLLFLINSSNLDEVFLYRWAADMVGSTELPEADQPKSSSKNPPRRIQPVTFQLEVGKGSPGVTLSPKRLLRDEEDADFLGYPEGRIAGQIGLGFLLPQVTLMDFAKKTITLLPKGGAGAGITALVGKEGVVALEQYQGWNPGIYVRGNLYDEKGKAVSPVLFEIGTNYDYSVLPQSTASLFDPSRRSVLGTNPKVEVSQLELGGATTEKEIFDIEDRSGGPLLGVNVLPRFTLTIDRARGLMQFTPRAGYTNPRMGFTGIYLKESYGKVYVSAVDPVLVPSTVPVAAGDRIVAIDGKKMEGLSTFSVSAYLNIPAGTPVRIELEEAVSGKRKTVTLPRHDRIASPPRADNAATKGSK
jgi:C-terminal processing protease CtpA/Prc